ncbi:MAG: endo-1,4-beta-xylanase [Chitinophagaceae bacterium]
MKKHFKIIIAAGVVAGGMAASGCKKVKYEPQVLVADTTLTLKTAAQYLLGVGADYDSIMNNSLYAATVKEQFNSLTPGYVMKHGSVVQANGTYNFSKPDNLVNFCKQAGIAVYGHTLCWYQNNNGNYLRSLLALPGSAQAPNPNQISNGGFETGTAGTISNTGTTYGTICTGWTGQIQGTGIGSFSLSTGADEFYNGTRGLKAVVTTPAANGYQFQAFPPDGAPNLNSGTSYRVSFYAKHVGSATPKIRVQTQNGGYQTADVTVTTSWAKYTCDLTPSGAATRFNFQFLNAGTFYIDSVTLTLTNPGTTTATNAEKNYRIDTTLKNFITAMVGHYKADVRAWDVVNELFKDNGQYRDDPTSESDMFPWWTYLGGGDSVIIKAFKYAHDADPTALLFINDYNQEASTAKTDSMVSVINRMKKAGVPIDGVGLQMHFSVNTPNTGIDYALLKLASTGLKVKISELDIRVNPAKTPNFVTTQALMAQQAAKYKYVVESYLRNVPAAQRYGITVWGVTDKDSWLVTAAAIDYPLLYDASFKKKSAFYEFLSGLQLK